MSVQFNLAVGEFAKFEVGQINSFGGRSGDLVTKLTIDNYAGSSEITLRGILDDDPREATITDAECSQIGTPIPAGFIRDIDNLKQLKWILVEATGGPAVGQIN